MTKEVVVQIPMPKKDYDKLRALKGTRRSWLTFLKQEILREKDSNE